MKKICILLMFIIPLYSVLAQDKNKATAVEERKFTPAQLKEDFSIMSEVFTSLHPALYEFTSKERFNSLLDSTRQRLTKEMNVLEFYKMLSPIISQLGCGHTAVGLPGKEENYSTSFLPIKLKFLGEKAYIIDNYSTSPLLKPGLEVSSINQEPMPEIVETLFSYIQTDGYSKSNKYYFLDRRFENYYGLYIAQPAAFSIEVVDKSGIKTQVKVEALKQRGRSVQKANSIQKHPLPFYMNILDSKTALMTIDLFYVDDQSKQEAYPQFLDSCFSFINQNKIQNLIIDLRQNPGGYGTWGALLYSYLAEAPFAYYKRAVVATDKALPFSKHLKLDYTKEEYEQYLKEIIRTEQGTLLWTNHENLQIQQPQKNPFKGKVYVLIGRKSFSTTAEFCAIAFSNKRAVFIGEETGGGYYHINGGDLPELTLPHSKIKFQLPMRKYELAVKEYLPKGSPTLPHYYVAQPIEDFLSNEDTELKFTLNLIKQTNKK